MSKSWPRKNSGVEARPETDARLTEDVRSYYEMGPFIIRFFSCYIRLRWKSSMARRTCDLSEFFLSKVSIPDFYMYEINSTFVLPINWSRPRYSVRQVKPDIPLSFLSIGKGKKEKEPILTNSINHSAPLHLPPPIVEEEVTRSSMPSWTI